MKNWKQAAAAGFAVVALGAGVVSAQKTERSERAPQPKTQQMREQAGRPNIEEHVRTWSEPSQKAAKAMVQKYGPPQGMTDTMLVWNDNGPWKRTVIYSEAVDHNFPMPHKDVLEQFINYETPVDKFDELAAYDGSVIAERTKGVISARCDKEEANFLALNLANEIVAGKRSVPEARDFYATTIKGLMAGKTSPYTSGLMFEPPTGNVGDPDEAVIQRPAGRRPSR